MKDNRVILIVVGILLLCCCIAAVAVVISQGPALGNYLNSLSSGAQSGPGATTSPATSAPGTSSPSTGAPSGGPAAGGLGNNLLKTDVWNSIINYESTNGCNDVTSTSIAVSNGPDSKGVWTENWAVQACGHTIVFKVKLIPDSKGGTNFSISH